MKTEREWYQNGFNDGRDEAESKMVSPSVLAKAIQDKDDRITELEDERDKWKEIAGQINTDWIPANKKLSDRIKELEGGFHELKDEFIHLIDFSNKDYCQGVNDCIDKLDKLLNKGDG